MSDIERTFDEQEQAKEPYLVLPQCEPVDKDVYEKNIEVLEHISSLRKDYESEMIDERSTEYDKQTETHYLLYTYADSDIEKVSFKECPEIALLTLMEEAVKEHPSLLQGDNLVDLFWERSKAVKDFDDLHQRLELDFHERLVIRSYMEEIAKMPDYIRKDSLLLNKIMKDLEQENERIIARVQAVNDSYPEITQILPGIESATTLYDQGKEKGKDRVVSNPPEDEPENPRRSKKKLVIVGALLLAACSGVGGNLLTGESDESLPLNVENGAVPTTFAETTTTTSTLPPTITSTTIPLVIAPVETTTPETVLLETVPADTVSVETTTPETVPAPVETAPPETIPPSSAVPTPSNDVFLSEELCNQYGGSPHRFQPGETLVEYLQTLGLTREQAYKVSGSEELMTKFKLEGGKVTASTEGLSGAECVPLWPEMKHLFAQKS